MKLNEINIRDPFILPYNKKYYMYGSRVGGQTGFDVYVSDDLENWSSPKSIFEKNDNFWGEKEFWAPEVHLYNNQFYMLASFKAEGKCRATHILTAQGPDQLFCPVSENPATPDDWECLDGTLYVDQKGNPHMVFCHEWTQISDGTICEIQLSKDLSRTVSAPRELWKASDYKNVKSVFQETSDFVTDGPFLFRDEKGDLLCIWSTFNENGYTELISKSSNGDIDGTWSVLEQPLSSEDGGHGMIFQNFSGSDYFVMHKPNIPGCERPVISKLLQEKNTLFLQKLIP